MRTIFIDVTRATDGSTQTPVGQDGDNALEWVLQLYTGALPSPAASAAASSGATSAYLLPLLQVAISRLLVSSTDRPDEGGGSSTATAAVAVTHAPRASPGGAFALSCNGRSSGWATVGAAADDVLAALLATPASSGSSAGFGSCLPPTATLSLTEINTQAETGYVYDLVLPMGASWGGAVDRSAVLPVLFGPISLDIGPSNGTRRSGSGSGSALGSSFLPSVTLTTASLRGSALLTLEPHAPDRLVVPSLVTIRVSDLGQAGTEVVASAEVRVYVLPVADVPALSLPSSSVTPAAATSLAAAATGGVSGDVGEAAPSGPSATMNEDESMVIAGATLEDTDGTNAVVSVTITWSAGSVSAHGGDEGAFVDQHQATVTTAPDTGSGGSVVVKGDVASVSRLLSRLVLQPRPDWNGEAALLFVVSPADDGSSTSTSSSIGSISSSVSAVSAASESYQLLVRVLPLPDPPSIAAPATLAAEAGQAAKLGLLLVSNADNLYPLQLKVFLMGAGGLAANSTPASSTASSSSGNVILYPQLAELTFREYGPSSWHASPTLTITGGTRMINTILRYLAFRGGSSDAIALELRVPVSGPGPTSGQFNDSNRYTYAAHPAASAVVAVTVLAGAQSRALTLAPCPAAPSGREDTPLTAMSCLAVAAVPMGAALLGPEEGVQAELRGQMAERVGVDCIVVAEAGMLELQAAPSGGGGGGGGEGVGVGSSSNSSGPSFVVLSSGPLLHLRAVSIDGTPLPLSSSLRPPHIAARYKDDF